jgi:glycosyltransferase involved in cell wall biosynthesis
MLLSIYTYVKDALFYDLHLVDMLKHHLPLADEIVVNEGYSKDNTYEAIRDLDPKIKVVRHRWNQPAGTAEWYLEAKDTARRLCQGEWCFHLDADEFVPEWEFEEIRRHIAGTNEELIPIRFLNFYANYKVFHGNPQKIGWPAKKMILHRNRPDVQFWGDGANVRLKDQKLDWEKSPLRYTVHHFGTVRNAARLREKWHIQAGVYAKKRRWFHLPSFLFNWRPHDWRDPMFLQDLQIYEGPYIKAVKENPDEFVRDGFQMYDYLKKLGR